jgi:hypothetical protein
VNTLDLQQADDGSAVPHLCGMDAPANTQPGLLKRFADWIFNEFGPPKDESVADWSDRQW